ncbi:hypothetical protein EAF04_008306 [Stromatinia cepivora]|nr:hypothetical protein EAF04_008306 [Stromatinia cepivora]
MGTTPQRFSSKNPSSRLTQFHYVYTGSDDNYDPPKEHFMCPNKTPSRLGICQENRYAKLKLDTVDNSQNRTFDPVLPLLSRFVLTTIFAAVMV